jgi:ApbE superfamily uncharacterized protein (UPF0280 family)
MPLGSARKLSNQACLALPKASISVHSSAPQITAQMAMAREQMALGPIDAGIFDLL